MSDLARWSLPTVAKKGACECSSKTTTFKEDVNVPVVSTSDHCTLQADVTGVANNVPASDPVTCDMNPTGLQRPTGPQSDMCILEPVIRHTNIVAPVSGTRST
ncbi:hypothetical protein Tco_0151873 [Tanacetum coccineum]